MPGQLSALILLEVIAAHGDWWNHAREATSPLGGRRLLLHFRLEAMLEWRSQTTSNKPSTAAY